MSSIPKRLPRASRLRQWRRSIVPPGEEIQGEPWVLSHFDAEEVDEHSVDLERFGAEKEKDTSVENVLRPVISSA